MKRTAVISNKSLIISVTGHRHFASLKQYQTRSEQRQRFFDHLDNFMHDFLMNASDVEKERMVLQHGCARGVDLWFGEWTMEHGYRLGLYLPFKFEDQIRHGKFKPYEVESLQEQMNYPLLMRLNVVGKKYHPRVYGKRNRMLVDAGDILVSYYTRERSGSGHAVRYALSKEKPVFHLYNWDQKHFHYNRTLGECWRKRHGEPKKVPRRTAVEKVS